MQFVMNVCVLIHRTLQGEPPWGGPMFFRASGEFYLGSCSGCFNRNDNDFFFLFKFNFYFILEYS